MNLPMNPEQLEIQKLRAEVQRQEEALRRKEEELVKTRRRLSQQQQQQHCQQHQQSSPYPPQLSQSSESSFPDVSAVHNEFQLSAGVPSHHGLSRSNTIPRAAATGSHSRHEPATRPSINQYGSNGPHAVKRQRTLSQQIPASQKMDRTASNLSTRSAGPGPFTGTAPISPPPRPQNATAQSRNSATREYTSRDEPVNPYAFAQPMQQHHSNRHRQEMPTLTEFPPSAGNVWDPAVWLESHDYMGDAPPPMTDPFGSLGPHQEVPQFNINDVSVCGSMTTAPTYDTAPMTRQNSMVDNQSVSGAIHMMRIGSQRSQGTDPFPTTGSGDTSPLGKRPYPSEDALLAVGSSLVPPSAHQYAASAPNEGLLATCDMERSLSSTSMASTKSTSSLKVRAKDTLKLQNERAAKNAVLKPKPIEQNPTESSAGSKKDGKAVIAKTKYVRPKQPKVFCDQCDEHKDGFRGEHELRRHKDAKHQGVVKKWICVDPTSIGLPIGVAAVNPLEKCKACKAQKKYGAYYNAAAHLRRTHFKEKPSRQKNKGNANRGEDDKRGGKGGGDWPPMSELKNWMQEIYVSGSDQLQDEDEEGEEDIMQQTPDMDMSQRMAPPTGGLGSNVEYTFPHHLALNTANATGFMMPLSSADFANFSSPSELSPSFPIDIMTYSTQEQMSHFSSAVSSSATITPMTAFNEASQLEDLGYDNMIYTQ
ncbi:hypothetical protein F5Y15DRAFT_172726 [Xylariaceae sp. FL0016]|nr:hypothetical protein F5Y15DRAFT_172726 [Xylariaceae sp. FL0016]